MAAQPRVLISGASVAGPVLAYWLGAFGFCPTVVERTAQLRAGGGGHAVDLFGPVLDVMDWMGLRDQIGQARTTTEVMTMIRPGRRPVEAPMEMLSAGVSDRHLEIMRGDLAQIVFEATRGQVEYIFGDSVVTLEDNGSRVDVTFEHADPRSCDLVVGADGLHSTTRRLRFGPELDFTRFLGGYLAVFTVPNDLELSHRMVGLSVPGRTAWLYPVGDGTLARAGFLWRTPRPHVVDRHDLDVQRRLLRNLYGDLGWEVPRLLAHLDRADDLYLDSITQVVMPRWTSGRVALVGDAGYCPGPAVGGGTSLAIVGAYVLAAELAAAGGDHVTSFPAYERAMAETVRQSHTVGPAVLRTLVPVSRTQVRAMPQLLGVPPRLPPPLRRWLTSFGGGPARMLDGVVLKNPTTSGQPR